MEIFGKKPVIPQSRFQKPSKPAPVQKGPFEKQGGIPREKFPGFFKKGPYSIPWSRQVGSRQQKALGEKLLKRFPQATYGLDISGPEMQRELGRLRQARFNAKTKVEQDTLTQDIVRLENAKKRAGL